MLRPSASPSANSSSPANGSTGQKPRAASAPASSSDPAVVIPKNSSAPRRLSDAFALTRTCPRSFSLLAETLKSSRRRLRLRKSGLIVSECRNAAQQPAPQPGGQDRRDLAGPSRLGTGVAVRQSGQQRGFQ